MSLLCPVQEAELGLSWSDEPPSVLSHLPVAGAAMKTLEALALTEGGWKVRQCRNSL